MNKSLISVKNLSYSVSRNNKLLDDLSFEINENEICIITGPNGSGKTTLIKILMGFIGNFSGSVTHHDLKNYSYVPQGFDVPSYINLDVKSFLKFTDMKSGIFKTKDVIDLLNLNDLLNISLKNISGGQLRKVLIAKSLLGSDKIIFLDEPTCWLDLESQEEFFELIKKLISISKISIVIITHDRFLLDKNFAKIISLNKNHVCFNNQ
jgi:ABC-type Mn2+/Zn2+ transport system ATPase subunit